MNDALTTSLYIFVLAGFLGFEVIRRVPKLLHTPLMSLTNALSAIALVGSLVLAGSKQGSPGPGQITLCHSGNGNNFTEITVDASGSLNGHADHNPDIIPPFTVIDQGGVKATLKDFTAKATGTSRVADETGILVQRTLKESRSYGFTLESTHDPGKVYKSLLNASEATTVDLLE